MAIVAQDQAHGEAHGHEVPYAVSLRMDRLGLWLFCFSELFLFGGLLVARFVLWGGTRPELNQSLGFLTTSILLLSSIFMAMAESAIGHDTRQFQSNLNRWSEQNRQVSLFNECMAQKGYSPRSAETEQQQQ